MSQSYNVIKTINAIAAKPIFVIKDREGRYVGWHNARFKEVLFSTDILTFAQKKMALKNALHLQNTFNESFFVEEFKIIDTPQPKGMGILASQNDAL